MESPGSPSPGYTGEDRRQKPRIDEHFPAKVRGVDESGHAFEVEALLDNLSARGLYMRLMRQVEEGARLFVLFQLVSRLTSEVKGLRVSAQGRVLRSEPQPDGACGVAIAFERYRFLWGRSL